LEHRYTLLKIFFHLCESAFIKVPESFLGIRFNGEALTTILPRPFPTREKQGAKAATDYGNPPNPEPQNGSGFLFSGPHQI
jgi:hypothetical protein